MQKLLTVFTILICYGNVYPRDNNAHIDTTFDVITDCGDFLCSKTPDGLLLFKECFKRDFKNKGINVTD